MAEGAVALSCPSDFLGVPMVVAAALAIGGTRRIVAKAGWSEAPALYAAIIGSPGSAKTPSLKQVLEPLEQFQLQWERDFDLECRKDPWADADSDTPYVPPNLRRILSTDATMRGPCRTLGKKSQRDRDNPRRIGRVAKVNEHV